MANRKQGFGSTKKIVIEDDDGCNLVSITVELLSTKGRTQKEHDACMSSIVRGVADSLVGKDNRVCFAIFGVDNMEIK